MTSNGKVREVPSAAAVCVVEERIVKKAKYRVKRNLQLWLKELQQHGIHL